MTSQSTQRAARGLAFELQRTRWPASPEVRAEITKRANELAESLKVDHSAGWEWAGNRLILVEHYGRRPFQIFLSTWREPGYLSLTGECSKCLREFIEPNGIDDKACDLEFFLHDMMAQITAHECPSDRIIRICGQSPKGPEDASADAYAALGKELDERGRLGLSTTISRIETETGMRDANHYVVLIAFCEEVRHD